MRKPSLKRALGVTKAKRNFARMTGIPTTSSGRQRKVGKIATGGCCSFYLIGFFILVILLVTSIIIYW